MAFYDNLAAVAYYTATALGSVSLGYAVIRLAHPETRLLDDEHKLGYSAITGFAIVAAALVLDSAVTSPDRVLQAKGVFPFMLAATAVAGFVSLKAWLAMHAPKVAIIGVPLHERIEEKHFQKPEKTGESLAQAVERREDLKQVEAPRKRGGVEELSFAELYASLGEEQTAAKRRKTLEEILSKAKELKKK